MASSGEIIQNVYVTAYGWPDNDPPGRAIAYPGSAPRHRQATADLGSYDHPITLAADTRWLPAGTRVYIPGLQRYFIMEDECASCEEAYGAKRRRWVDVWVGPDSAPSSTDAVYAAQEAVTLDSSSIELNPPAGRPVSTVPLFNPVTGGHFEP